ncbi:caspase domain-containing protein [Lactifluus subvellereus]|nr:caspase domain-containing protein [Lactifluus subvellereus]
MGALISSLFTRCISLWSRRANSPPEFGRIPIPDIEEGKSNGTIPKRRGLLVGISYSKSKSWSRLVGPYDDVDKFQKLLIDTYGYSPEDITILKDDPQLPDLFQPTHSNMIRELTRLVSDAAPGDKFVFLYSGHSDQQLSQDGSDIEEDGQDEVIITSDEERIIDNRLKEILVDPLKPGCSLLAILDTCHSGTMLDLPHHHCNSVYVPWLSKGHRRTATMHNKAERRGAMPFTGSSDSASRLAPSITSVLSGPQLAVLPLRINTEVSSTFSTNRRTMSTEAHPSGDRCSWGPASILSPSRTGVESPISRVTCSGWCDYDPKPRPNVVSLSACADLQRAWEGPRGSLTMVLCDFLGRHPHPSYRELMTHVNFQLYANCCVLHEYTRAQKKMAARGEGPGFDGELNNFQTPELSSLAKLDMNEVLQL